MILSSVLPVSDYKKAANPQNERTRFRPPAMIRQINDWMKRYCAANGCVYLDYFSEMVDQAGMLKADLAEDGLHPNAAGYRLMAPMVKAAITSVEKSGAPPPPRAGRFPRR